MILLDTNVCIEIMRDPDQSETLVTLLLHNGVSFAVISSVSLYELEMGVVGRGGEKQARASLIMLLNGPIRVEPLTASAARSGAVLNAAARNQGQQLSALDGLIAGHAVALGATLVTNDARLAAAVSEIEVISWR
jgi:tRNA(fMet)-specific endonuclease VapC